MDSNIAIDYRNPNEIRKLGIDALTKELGAIGMVSFMRQFDNGDGDYTTDREDLLADLTIEDIESGIGK